jgi:hypothetical protein
MAEGVGGRDRLGAVVDRRRPDEAFRWGMRERVDGPREPLLRQPLRLAAARPETGAPQQALGLRRAERPTVEGNGAWGGDAT